MQTQQVVVLNADFSQINLVSWKRAFSLVSKEKAEIVKYTDEVVENISGSTKFRIPSVIKLVAFVKNVYKGTVRVSKRYVHIRDGKTCGYCGVNNQKMSVDHIIPVSKGGKTSWSNLVCCCSSCNNKKADKTLKESGMTLLIKPYAPSMAQFLKCRMRNLNLQNL